MDSSQWLTSDFWQSSSIELCSNPQQVLPDQGLLSWANQQAEPQVLGGHFIIPTSGTTGEPRWVALSKQALLYAAQQINQLFIINSDDKLALNLPLFHVGGLSILARCYLAQAACCDLRNLHTSGKLTWDAHVWQQQCQQQQITIASLVPTQVADLVSSQLSCPSSIRIIFVGGDYISDELTHKAVQLGWPLHRCYGMTETSAMLAVEQTPNSGMYILPHWKYQPTSSGKAQFKGPSLFTGYLTQNNEQHWQLTHAADKQGWFTSQDSLQLNNYNQIQGVERTSSIVKILGEKVSLTKQLNQLHQAVAQAGLQAQHAIIRAPAHSRKGVTLVPVWENIQHLDTSELQKKLELASRIYHAKQPSGLTALEAWKIVARFERTALGKISDQPES